MAVVDGALIYSQQCDAFYRFIDPQQGTFERVRDRLPVSNGDWLFTDDDGKVYLYAVGFKPNRGIYVYELDPLYTDTYLGDLPKYGVGHRKAGPGGNLVGWMLLSHKKQATASSVLPEHPIEHASDENIKTWWSAKTITATSRPCTWHGFSTGPASRG